MSNSLQPQGLLPARLFCPWDFPARILQWAAISFSRASSQPRNGTLVSYIFYIGRQGFFFYHQHHLYKKLIFPHRFIAYVNTAKLYNLPVCVCVCVCVCACLVVQLCLTLCNPMDCNPPSSSVPGLFQARILEWVAISYSRVYQYVILVSLNQCNYLYISHFYFLACNLFGEEP